MTQAASFQWDDTRFKAFCLDAADAGIGAAAEVIVAQAKINLSRQGQTKAAAKGAKRIKKFGGDSDLSLSRRILGAIGRDKVTGRLRPTSRRGVEVLAAKDLIKFGSVDPPGGFPRLITGYLRRSIKAGYAADGAPVKGERVVGSTMDPKLGYAAAQEYGSAKIGLPARPYVRPAAALTQAKQVEEFFRAAKAVMDTAT